MRRRQGETAHARRGDADPPVTAEDDAQEKLGRSVIIIVAVVSPVARLHGRSRSGPKRASGELSFTLRAFHNDAAVEII